MFLKALYLAISLFLLFPLFGITIDFFESFTYSDQPLSLRNFEVHYGDILLFLVGVPTILLMNIFSFSLFAKSDLKGKIGRFLPWLLGLSAIAIFVRMIQEWGLRLGGYNQMVGIVFLVIILSTLIPLTLKLRKF